MEHASHSPVDRPGKYDTMAAPMISMAKIGMMWRWPAACLDEVGLTGRDRDGFRTFPDGSKLTIQVAADQLRFDRYPHG